jgi:hypothetical protein
MTAEPEYTTTMILELGNPSKQDMVKAMPKADWHGLLKETV